MPIPIWHAGVKDTDPLHSADGYKRDNSLTSRHDYTNTATTPTPQRTDEPDLDEEEEEEEDSSEEEE